MKPGRPPLGDAKRKRLEVALSFDERVLLQDAATRAGLSLAAYIREAALACALASASSDAER